MEQAKRIAQTVELEIAAAIPEDVVIEIRQRPRGSLLRCSGERNYQWAGGTTVDVRAEANLSSIIDGIVSSYSGREGWEAGRTTSVDGAPEVHLDRERSGGYAIAGWEDPHTVNIFSFSPCFHLPKGVSSRGGF